MSSYKSFAVAGGLGGGKPGSANIGNLIVKNLVKVPGVNVKVLARPESVSSSGTSSHDPDLTSSFQVNSPAAKELIKLGVTVVSVDYSDQAKVVDALKDSEVLISTLNTAAIAVQSALVDAVATGKTGVKLFVPSEFGNDTTKVKDEKNSLFAKRKVQLDLEEKKIPYAVFITGPFADWVGSFAGYAMCITSEPLTRKLTSRTAFRPDKDGKIRIVGSGDEKVSFTAINDAARFVAHILTGKPVISRYTDTSDI